ncbi:MAG: hypothetical protein COA85_11930 [Robiginitomaculum sp.]|nr:MAG: hypothetical protein COA85_11930 [Robiginitomaculum sp.]
MFLLAMLLPAKVANAQARPLGFATWHFYGANTIRYDNFHTHGDQRSSPFRFTGSQQYDEFSLNFDRAFSSYNRVTGNFSGVLNDSDYRSRFNGLVPERINIRQENGTFVVPYRAEIGDFFAFQSYRTIQRSLKGMQVEFQPDLSDTTQASIQFFSGMASRDWRDIKARDGVSSGVSMMLDNAKWGTLGANLLFNYKQADGKRVPVSTRQYVYSAVYGNKTKLAGQHLDLQGEIGLFDGDHRDLTGTNSGQNRTGNAYFAQVSGGPVALSQLGYRFRYEVYGQDYRPDTASIQPDRRSAEGHVSWRFRNGLTARGRVQSYRLNRQTLNPRDSDVYGVNVGGPILPGTVKGFSGNFDAYQQTDQSLDKRQDQRRRVIYTRFNKTIMPGLSARAGYFYTHNKNRVVPTIAADITRQFTLGLDYRFEALGFKGTVSPGLVARSTGKVGAVNHEYNPTLRLSGRRGPHNISMNYSVLDQNRRPNSLGLITYTAGAKYSYDWDKYRVGVDANWYRRSPNDGTVQNTNAWRVGMFLTLNFDTSVGRHQKSGERTLPEAPTELLESKAMVLDIAQLAPGLDVIQARKLAIAAGLGKPTSQGNTLLWYNRIIRDMEQEQRLLVQVQSGKIIRSALLIAFDDLGNAINMKQIYEQALQKLLLHYGKPSSSFIRGEFGPEIDADLASGQFIRVMQWQTENGVLRFGIPRRLDGILRMELQFSRSFTDPRDSQWSLEEAQ